MSKDKDDRQGRTEAEQQLVQIAYERTRAEAHADATATREASLAFADAASAVLRDGGSVAELSRLETIGVDRAMREVSKDLLKSVTAAANRKRQAESAYEEAVRTAGRLLSYGEVGKAAGVAANTIRSIVKRPEQPIDAGAGAVAESNEEAASASAP